MHSLASGRKCGERILSCMNPQQQQQQRQQRQRQQQQQQKHTPCLIMNPKRKLECKIHFSTSILFSSSLVAKHPPFRQVTKNKAQSQSRSFLVDPKKLENHYISWRGTLVVYVPFWRAGSRICRKPSKMRNLMSLELWSTSWRTKLLPKIVWILKKRGLGMGWMIGCFVVRWVFHAVFIV